MLSNLIPDLIFSNAHAPGITSFCPHPSSKAQKHNHFCNNKANVSDADIADHLERICAF